MPTMLHVDGRIGYSREKKKTEQNNENIGPGVVFLLP